MKKYMMTAAALMMAAISLTACGGANRAETEAEAGAALPVAAASSVTESTAASLPEATATYSDFASEAVTSAATELTAASTAKQTETKKQTASARKTAPAKQASVQKPAEQASAPAQQNTPADPNEALWRFTDADRIETAKSLIQNYIEANDNLCYGVTLVSGGAPVVIDRNGHKAEYFKVSVPNEQGIESLDDLRFALSQGLTGKAYEQALETATGGDLPIYREFDGELYLLSLGKGTLYGEVLWDTLTLCNISDKTFSATVRMSDCGNTCTYRFDFVDVSRGCPLDYMICDAEILDN